MIHLISTTEVKRISLLKQFVAHYQSVGVEKFHISVHFESGTEPAKIREGVDRAARSLKPLGVEAILELVCPFDAMNLRAHHDEIQDALTRPDDWIVWADVDEFQMHAEPLAAKIGRYDNNEINICSGFLVDRIARSGKLNEFQPSQSIWRQFPMP